MGGDRGRQSITDGFKECTVFNDRADQMVETGNAVACALLSQAKAENQRAWDVLVDLFGEMIYRWCRESGLKPEEARDVGQDVFASIANLHDPWERARDHGSFCRWLRLVTGQTIAKFDYGPDSFSDLGSVLVAADSEADTVDSRHSDIVADDRELFIRILNHARDQISPEHWRVFWQVIVEGHKPADVASRFHMARHEIYVIKSRVLWLLRDYFECDVVGGGT